MQIMAVLGCCIFVVYFGLRYPLFPKPPPEVQIIYRRALSGRDEPIRDSRFHIVQNYLLYIDSNMKEGETKDSQYRQNRQNELIYTLKANLNNPMIASVNILYTHKPLIPHLQKLNLSNGDKLKTHYYNDTPNIQDMLIFIETSLQNKFVMLSNQDIEIGDGWNQLDLKKFRDHRMFYAMTRHVREQHMKDPDCYARENFHCHADDKDIGAYDTFVFYMEGRVPAEMKAEMNYTQGTFGMENVIVWYAKNVWEYNVLNPCRTLKIYHIDCRHIDMKKRDRQPRDDHIGRAAFTDQLYV